jgi:hypothetical protein
MDLKDDLWTSQVRAMSDAQLLANVTIVPAIVWAFLWTLLSVAILVMGGWFALKDRKAQQVESSAKPVPLKA